MNHFLNFNAPPFAPGIATYCKGIEQLSLHSNQQEFEL